MCQTKCIRQNMSDKMCQIKYVRQNVSNKICQTQCVRPTPNTHFTSNNISLPEIRRLWDRWKDTVQLHGQQISARRMRISRRAPKTTNTHSEYVNFTVRMATHNSLKLTLYVHWLSVCLSCLIILKMVACYVLLRFVTFCYVLQRVAGKYFRIPYEYRVV
jgi:hypothetical protein